MKEKRINCHNCKYFYITWDYVFPKGCKLFQIKSKELPSKLVYQSTGNICLQFEEKFKK